MATIEKILKKEQVILNTKGKPEFVVLPIAEYTKMLQMLEDFGLGQAIIQAEANPRYDKIQALAILEGDDN
jgi:RelB Antitoxin alpha helical domain